MILLDTNVVAEVTRVRPSAAVLSWLDAQPRSTLYLCTPVLAELRFGVARLDAGARRDRFAGWVDRLEADGYRGRILPLDAAAAAEFGRIAAARERAGNRMLPTDALIAAIALTHRATLATRDVRDFADLGLDIVDPFEPTQVA